MTPTISQMKDIMNNTTKDNIIDRDELQDQYIKELIDSMDFKTMETSVNELIDEVKDSYPELLDDTSEDDLPEPDESTGWN